MVRGERDKWEECRRESSELEDNCTSSLVLWFAGQLTPLPVWYMKKCTHSPNIAKITDKAALIGNQYYQLQPAKGPLGMSSGAWKSVWGLLGI